ncbi:MAG: hypothetical protein ACK4VV_05525 [Pseudomonas sp.]
MKKFVLACIFILAGISNEALAKEVNFDIAQGHEDWAFSIKGKGRAVIGKTLIYVKMDNLVTVNNPKHNKAKYIEKISIGFGYLQPDGKWNVRRAHNGEWSVKKDFPSGHMMSFGNYDAALWLRNESPEDFWIVITIEMDNRSKVYAHSKKDVFKTD